MVTWTMPEVIVFKALGNVIEWFLSYHLSNCDLPWKIRKHDQPKADSPGGLRVETHLPILRCRSGFSFEVQ